MEKQISLCFSAWLHDISWLHDSKANDIIGAQSEMPLGAASLEEFGDWLGRRVQVETGEFVLHLCRIMANLCPRLKLKNSEILMSQI